MKIIQTFWSCHKPDVESLLTHKGGWQDNWHHLVSWALSCSLARKHYPQVELVTDRVGKELLVDLFGLPYTRVHAVLDACMEAVPEQLWAFPKIIAYSLQKTPFIHIDGDVFLQRRLGSAAETARVVAQNLETGFPIYHEAMRDIAASMDQVPPELTEHWRGSTVTRAANMGLFGGADLAFIGQYAARALRFAGHNRHNLNHVNTIYFNCVYEQYFLYVLLQKHGVKATYLLRPVHRFEEYGDLLSFGSGGAHGFVHLVGPYKWNPASQAAMRGQLEAEFGPTYRRVMGILGALPAATGSLAV